MITFSHPGSSSVPCRGARRGGLRPPVSKAILFTLSLEGPVPQKGGEKIPPVARR
jgi:hypothetical protein